ncbi:beta-galactosidase [Nilaparvata lugens]|uniref:beta-galactosidase n=1 Tax=Nilaparvata lugens TaxID=108931 RepID=UPI00193E311E|nr:beta-galactosidase [Nilaparvata lugens]
MFGFSCQLLLRALIFFILLTGTWQHQNEASDSAIAKKGRSFRVDYESGQLLKDGVPFRYMSGSIHYFRLPKAYWRDRLIKMKNAGLNAISTYVEWSQHEPTLGVYDFGGDLDLLGFIDLAHSLGLLVILRPGPYICAERDLGGYPPWLFTLHPNMVLRTSDSNHKNYVKKWLDHLMPMVVPLLYGNGGPIIMVQVENEYGSYYACDGSYTMWLRDLFKSYVKDDAVLFTTDGGAPGYLKCGVIPDVLITVDFGPRSNVDYAFNAVKKAGQTNGPFINSEFYPGWLTRWNEVPSLVRTEDIVQGLRKLMAYGNNTSFNFYMFFGGTNFGYTAGANCDDSIGYMPQLTSYDYDAPITEAGDLTSKYFAIRDTLKDYTALPSMTDFLDLSGKASYGTVEMVKAVSLFDVSPRNPVIVNQDPMSFESLNLRNGFVLYEHTLDANELADPSQLYVPGLRDRAIVLLDKKAVGVLSRFRSIYSIPILARAGQKLGLLVESEGRINYGTFINDTKGIVCKVLLNGKELSGWSMPTYSTDNIHQIEIMARQLDLEKHHVKPPAFYTGNFTVEHSGSAIAKDTYLNLQGWGKGMAFINGFNLGRYWVTTGPQVTLYVPGSILKSSNQLTIFELEHEHPRLQAQFQDYSYLNMSIPYLGQYSRQCQPKCRPVTTEKITS